MEMLLLRPSLEPALCCGLGKLPRAEPAVLNSWTPVLSASPKARGPPQCHFTQLSGFVRNDPGGTVSDANVLSFLGSKKYLRPQYLTHTGTQGTAPSSGQMERTEREKPLRLISKN